MNNGARTLGLIAFLLLLIFGLGVILQNAILGLIIIFMAIITLAIVMDPASAKALIKIFFPIMLLMLFLSIFIGQYGGITFDTAIILTLIIFAVFLMIGAFLGGTEIKSMLILSPIVVIPTLFAFLADPSGNLAIIISSTIIFGLMLLSWYLVRELGPAKDIEIPLKVGTAIEDINPHGRVKIGGEIWRAFSMNWRISKGEKVYVVDRRGLELVVVPIVTCPNCGEEYPITNVPKTCKICGTDLSLVALNTVKTHLRERESTNEV